MNLSFYTGVNGAAMQMSHMDVVGNNMANINTYGYKAGVAGFANLMYGYFLGAEEEMSYRGAGTLLVQNAADHSQGTFQGTDRTFDFAIEGDGFFGMYDPSNGEVTFTRDGSFAMAETTLENGETGWRLSDASGRFIINMEGNFIDIDPQADMLTHTPESLNIGVFDFQIRDGMLRQGSSDFLNVEKNGGIQLGTGIVHQGFLEISNVDLAKEMTKVIEAQRMYTYATKIISTSDEIEQTFINLKT